MSRFYQLLLEKISKKEIDEILNNPSGVLVGAEFEFELQQSFIEKSDHQYLDFKRNVDDSIIYDDEFIKWEKEYADWEESRDTYLMSIEDDDDRDDKEDKWIKTNPPPDEPDRPYNYIYHYDRDYSSISDEAKHRLVLNHIEINTNIDLEDWTIEKDASLDENGVELISPPMSLDKFLSVCEKIFKVIDEIGYTSSNCGLHIGVSLKSGMDNIDPVKLCLFTDEGYIWKFFDERKLNRYCKSMQRELSAKFYEKAEATSAYDEKSVIKLKSLLELDNIKNFMYDKSHYHGVNIEHLYQKNSYIEFRYMGGKGYHLNFDKVKTVILHYVYNLKLSIDPNFKKKEYVLKTTRLLHKFESWVQKREVESLKQQVKWYNKTEDKLKLKKAIIKLNTLPTLTQEETKALNKLISSVPDYEDEE